MGSTEMINEIVEDVLKHRPYYVTVYGTSYDFTSGYLKDLFCNLLDKVEKSYTVISPRLAIVHHRGLNCIEHATQVKFEVFASRSNQDRLRTIEYVDPSVWEDCAKQVDKERAAKFEYHTGTVAEKRKTNG